MRSSMSRHSVLCRDSGTKLRPNKAGRAHDRDVRVKEEFCHDRDFSITTDLV